MENFLFFLKNLIGKVPFVDKAAAMFYCWKDPVTPVWVKAAIAVALAYFLNPGDAIPDVLPGVGWTDDAGIIATTFANIALYIKPQHIQAAKKFFGS